MAGQGSTRHGAQGDHGGGGTCGPVVVPEHWVEALKDGDLGFKELVEQLYVLWLVQRKRSKCINARTHQAAKAAIVAFAARSSGWFLPGESRDRRRQRSAVHPSGEERTANGNVESVGRRSSGMGSELSPAAVREIAAEEAQHAVDREALMEGQRRCPTCRETTMKVWRIGRQMVCTHCVGTVMRYRGRKHEHGESKTGSEHSDPRRPGKEGPVDES